MSQYDYYTEEDWEKEFEHCKNTTEHELLEAKKELAAAKKNICELVAVIDEILPQAGALVLDIFQVNNALIHASAIVDCPRKDK